MISYVQEEDEGEYICYAENAAGRSEELIIVLDVQGESVLIKVVRKMYLQRVSGSNITWFSLLPIRHQAII